MQQNMTFGWQYWKKVLGRLWEAFESNFFIFEKSRLIYQACMKIGEKDFNEFLDKFIVLAEKDLQTTKLLLQKGEQRFVSSTVNLNLFFLFTTYCTGCLNLLCLTSNQHFLRKKWHSKQKPLIFGILSRGDSCMDKQLFGLSSLHSLYSLISKRFNEENLA